MRLIDNANQLTNNVYTLCVCWRVRLIVRVKAASGVAIQETCDTTHTMAAVVAAAAAATAAAAWQARAQATPERTTCRSQVVVESGYRLLLPSNELPSYNNYLAQLSDDDDGLLYVSERQRSAQEFRT